MSEAIENMDSSTPQDPSKYIKLTSSDKHEFYIERSHALSASSTLRNMFAGVDAIDGASKEVNLKAFPSYIVYNLCRYFMYRSHYADTTSEIPNFHIEPEVMVDLLMAADFMDC